MLINKIKFSGFKNYFYVKRYLSCKTNNSNFFQSTINNNGSQINSLNLLNFYENSYF